MSETTELDADALAALALENADVLATECPRRRLECVGGRVWAEWTTGRQRHRLRGAEMFWGREWLGRPQDGAEGWCSQGFMTPLEAVLLIVDHWERRLWDEHRVGFFRQSDGTWSCEHDGGALDEEGGWCGDPIARFPTKLHAIVVAIRVVTAEMVDPETSGGPMAGA